MDNGTHYASLVPVKGIVYETGTSGSEIKKSILKVVFEYISEKVIVVGINFGFQRSTVPFEGVIHNDVLFGGIEIQTDIAALEKISFDIIAL